MDYFALKKLLFDSADNKNMEFAKKVFNTSYKIVGLMTPTLKKLIQEHYKDEDLKLSDFEVGEYQEIDIFYLATALKRAKSYKEQMEFLKKNLYFVKGWAVTDVLNQYLKKATFAEYFPYFGHFAKCKSTYEARFAYIGMLRHYESPEIERIVPFLRYNEEYMIMMAEAWLLATAAIKHSGFVYGLLKDMDDEVLKKKTISKMVESYRISKEDKERFKALRR
ncbi:MAG: DNA alkylation repair protein [Bacilli bacterium]|nr:DNA alkylation repair protein [Bacilli bacterium]